MKRNRRCFFNLTGRDDQAVNDCFYLLFAFTSGSHGLLKGLLNEVDKSCEPPLNDESWL